MDITSLNYEEIYKIPIIKVLITIVVALIIQLTLRIVIDKIVRQAVRGSKYERKEDEKKREDTLITVFSTAASVALWIIVLLIVLAQLEVNLAALATGAGVIGVVVGFGAQNTIKDFLAGAFIIMENQYRVGDIVTVQSDGGPVSGLVEDITIRITRMRDLDGNINIVPNGSILVVTNLSFEFANVNVDVKVDYKSNLTKVREVMNQVGQAMMDDEQWKSHIMEPIQFLRVDGFEDSGVRIKALGKVEPGMQWDVAGEFRQRLVETFAKEKISIPLPQVVLHDSQPDMATHRKK